MGNRTALYSAHQALGARMVDFGGWDMPLHYGSQIEEHHQVRRHAGVFDVSHMTVIDLGGYGADDYLRRLLPNNIDKLREPGQALYSTLLNEQGGIIDDLIVYRVAPQNPDLVFRVIVNCSTAMKVHEWMQAKSDARTLITRRSEFCILAIQGPQAIAACDGLLPLPIAQIQGLERFHCALFGADHAQWLIARTGYTGEDGLEIILPHAAAQTLWRQLVDRGVQPAGLGARDTLRLEAGLCLYGQDMDESTTPLESNLGWTVSWKPEDRFFIGRAALQEQRKAGVARVLTGITLIGKGVMRHGQVVHFSKDQTTANGQTGIVTSGIFSPTLGYSIGLARVPAALTDAECNVDIRGKLVAARLVKPPFVRNGKVLV